ncbi:MAG: hypothetical protein JSS89_05035 [Bacteroidetes bacterium]|nr:hypothetical protein [Bacteroidota bacterium]
MSLVTFSGCSNPIVLWEAPVVYRGETADREYIDTIIGNLRPLAYVHITTADGTHTTTSNANGDWSITIEDPQAFEGFWFTKQDYDSSYIELSKLDVRQRGVTLVAILARTIIDNVENFRVEVDSMRNDTMWYRVHATLPPSMPFATIFFYDTAETDGFRIKKWSATLRTFTTVKARDCDGRSLVATDLHFVQPMYDTNTLFACAAVGTPMPSFTRTPDREGSNVVTVSGVGRLTALRAVRH